MAMIAVAAASTHERLPVVVERFDAPRWRVVLAERHDLVHVALQRLVQLAHGHVVPSLRATQDVPEPIVEALAIGRAQDGAELFDELIGSAEFAIESKEPPQVRSLLFIRLVPRAKHEPACALADGP